MKILFIKLKSKILLYRQGFVLPYTLFISMIMIIITTSVAVILTKQLYFSRIARQSQAAYYAADNAIACTLLLEETYTDSFGIGIFPYDPVFASPVEARAYMDQTLLDVNARRNALEPPMPPLAASISDIKCAQSLIFSETAPTNFAIDPIKYVRQVTSTTTEEGWTSTFNMKMDLGDGNFRCAKVTVNKTLTYRRIIAQGFSLCDRPEGSIERAIVNTSVIQ